MRLLLVEGNSAMRRLMIGMVGEIASVVEECPDGLQAVRAYTDFLPDWVLVNCELACTNGLALTRQIKAAHPGANILLIADYDDEKLRAAAHAAGACAFIVKEDLSELRRLLSRWEARVH